MATLDKIIKVTQDQYDTLAAGGTVGHYTGLDPNSIYLVENDEKGIKILHGSSVRIRELDSGIYELQNSGSNVTIYYSGLTATTSTTAQSGTILDITKGTSTTAYNYWLPASSVTAPSMYFGTTDDSSGTITLAKFTDENTTNITRNADSSITLYGTTAPATGIYFLDYSGSITITYAKSTTFSIDNTSPNTSILYWYKSSLSGYFRIITYSASSIIINYGKSGVTPASASKTTITFSGGGSDVNVSQTAQTTSATKYLLLNGATGGSAGGAYYNTNVGAITNATASSNVLYAPQVRVTGGTSSMGGCVMQYDSTNECIKFVF